MPKYQISRAQVESSTPLGQCCHIQLVALVEDPSPDQCISLQCFVAVRCALLMTVVRRVTVTPCCFRYSDPQTRIHASCESVCSLSSQESTIVQDASLSSTGALVGNVPDS